MQNKSEKHPKSLAVFFATEMWERYGFYVVQSLLALYLSSYFKWPDENTYALVGSFTALTYLSPVAGGWVADHLIGQKRSILLGATVLCLSYFLLFVFTGTLALTCSLAGIAVGTGLLKPNISSLLGHEYPINSSQRENGFTIFYMGITTGIILGTTLPSHLSSTFGWPIAFLSAAIGMIISFTTFRVGITLYHIKDYNPYTFQYKKILLALFLIVFLWSFAFIILNSPQFADILFALVAGISAIYIAYTAKCENKEQARKTIVIGLLCLISMVFWSFYFQMFMSLTLFISRLVQSTFCNLPFPPPYYITIQSLGMIAIGCFLSRYQAEKSLHERGLSIGKKFVCSMLSMTVAYAIITLLCHFNYPALIPPILIIPAFLIISLAELLISPVGLCAITMLADRNKVSTMMGVMFVSLGMGGFLSGKLSAMAAIPKGITEPATLLHLYSNAFSHQLMILSSATVGCFLVYLLIKRLLLTK